VRQAVVVSAGRRHYTLDFLALEWMRQHIVAAAIQDLGPKLFVGCPAGDDQLRLGIAATQVIEHLFPTPFARFTTGDDYVDRMLVDTLQGFAAVAGF